MSNNPQNQTSESVAVNFSEADHLFLDDLRDVGNTLTSSAEVNKLIYVIGKIEDEIERLKEQKREHKEFYDRKIQAADDQMDYLKGAIANYVRSQPDRKATTPNGTAYFTNRTKYTYPDDQTLLAFAKSHNIEYKVEEKPLKTPIKEYVEAGGEAPEGFEMHDEETLSIRSNN